MPLVKLIKQAYSLTNPKERQIILNNAATLSFLQLITYAIPIILIPYLFRAIGPDKFGLIAFVQAFALYFMIITDYGFNASAVKEISLCRDNLKKINHIFSAVMAAKIILITISLILGLIIVLTSLKFRKDWLIYLLGSGMIIGNGLFPLWFFQGIEKMKYITILNVAREISVLVFILIFVKHPDDYPLVIFITSIGYLATGILGQWIVFRHFKINFITPKITEIKDQFNSGWNIFISVAAINAYTASRVFVLGLFTNNIITGFYSIAERIANAVQTFPLNSFSQAIFPRLSKIFHTDENKAWNIMLQTQQITTLISIICLPVLIIFANPIVNMVCGNSYPETVLVLRLLLLSVFFVTANAFKVQFLLVCAKTKIYSRIHVVIAILGLPIIIIAIAKWSYIGAACATILMESLVFIATDIALKKLNFYNNK